MVKLRPDWCLSRQRYWGVPIPALICKSCNEYLLDYGFVKHFAKIVEKEGTDVWFTKEVSELMPEGFKHKKCGGSDFEKSEDILDVWFDSGVSHQAVLRDNPDLSLPAVEIYKNYFKKSVEEIKSLLMRISILYPLGIYLSDEEEYLLRNIIRIDPDGGLVCQGDIPEGSEIRIMMGTQESALQAAKQAAQEAKHAIKNSPLLGAIIFESASRIILLGHRVNEEINIIKNILGKDTPFIGVCTFGEQAPLRSLEYHGESHFHNETVAILTMGERLAFL